jgi:hypothetical protein
MADGSWVDRRMVQASSWLRRTCREQDPVMEGPRSLTGGEDRRDDQDQLRDPGMETVDIGHWATSSDRKKLQRPDRGVPYCK